MIPTFPEFRVQLLWLLVLLTGVAALGTRTDARASAVGVSVGPPVFDPFVEHAGLPADLAWLVQIERPAVQIDSEQGRSLASAVEQTELMAQTSKAWSRLARTLGGADDAFELLGSRVQFVAGTRSQGQPWAVCLQIDAEHRQRLLTRLKAFPRLHRDRRPISELEDGRYVLAVFDRGEHAVVLLGPRSDRLLSPTDDPKTALFFAMFDRLAGSTTPAGGDAPSTLAAPLEAVGEGEILIARRATSLSWNPLDGSFTIRDDEGERETGSPEGQGSGFVALRLDRAAGGWTGRLAVSERDGAGVAALAYERLGDALPTVSWVSLSPGVRAVLPLLVRRAGPLAGMLPEAGDAPGYAALLRTNPADAGSPPALAYVQRVDAGDGPARFDAAVAAALRSAQPGGDGPDHEGRYPGAVRVQPVEALPWPGSGARVVWGYSEPDGPTRTAAMVITPPHDAAGTGAAESSLRALLAAGGERPVEGAAVTTGSLRLAELQALHRALVAPVGEPGPILSRIESVWWSLTRSEIGGRPALLGPVSVTLTPSRQGVLGTK